MLQTLSTAVTSSSCGSRRGILAYFLHSPYRCRNMGCAQSPQAKFLPLCLLVIISCFVSISAAFPATKQEFHQPPYPVWPDAFTIKLLVYVEQYGPAWKSSGALFYNWPTKSFRADYYEWCLPLFDSGPGEFNNYSCSFVATRGNMYFVNMSSSNTWSDAQCCLFAEGLGPVPPDWVKNDQYNGTAMVRGVEVDVWWKPGTNDPNNPCYGYWNARDTQETPVRFFGLSSIGPTILDYWDFNPGKVVDISLPETNCRKECEPPKGSPRYKNKSNGVRVAGGLSDIRLTWPNWPACEE